MQYDFKLAAASLAVMLNKFSRRDLGFGKVDVNIGVDEGSWHVGIVGTYLDGEPLDVQGQGWSFAEAWGQFVQLLARMLQNWIVPEMA